jgi:glutathione S-transferase
MLWSTPCAGFVSVTPIQFRGSQPRGLSRAFRTAMSANPPKSGTAVLYVKAGKDGNSVGDCPFSMKANLALRLKDKSTEVQTIDLQHKPAWYSELSSSGTTPVYVGADGEVIDSSDEIVALADETGPKMEVKLYQENNPLWNASVEVIGPVFSVFAKWMKNKESDKDEQMRSELFNALEVVDEQIGKSGGPFLLGKEISALDCNFGPKLQHIVVAGKHFKDFELPEMLSNLQRFITAWRETPEWKASSCTDDTIVWGWSKFF